eukprot:11079403-Alexandrium_andersonii.AAC.3
MQFTQALLDLCSKQTQELLDLRLGSKGGPRKAGPDKPARGDLKKDQEREPRHQGLVPTYMHPRMRTHKAPQAILPCASTAALGLLQRAKGPPLSPRPIWDSEPQNFVGSSGFFGERPNRLPGP